MCKFCKSWCVFVKADGILCTAYSFNLCFKVLEKHFVIWKVLKYQYKYIAYVTNSTQVHYKYIQGLCMLKAQVPKCFVPSLFVTIDRDSVIVALSLSTILLYYMHHATFQPSCYCPTPVNTKILASYKDLGTSTRHLNDS